MLSAAAVLLCSCASVLHGNLTADWPGQGKQVTMTPDACESGERSSFFGVDMWTEGNAEAHIRGILDPVDGAIVKLDIPGVEQTLTLTPTSKCEVFEFTVEQQGPRTNHIYDIRGNLRLDCSEAGLVVKADITYSDCH